MMKNSEKGLVGVFAYPDDLVSLLKTAKRDGLTILTAYSPVKHDEITEILGKKTSPVKYFTLAGGILGILTGLGLGFYTSMQWNLMVSGKPISPIPPYIIIAFELCILIGVFFNLGAILLFSRIPWFRIKSSYDPRFSEDRYGAVIRCDDPEKERVREILTKAGAEEVYDIPG
jgi:hypothetical protein